jgi:cation diffusion facilitator CzcD-associated flavoprotein CzcO
MSDKSTKFLKERYPNHRLYDKWDEELEQFTVHDMIEFAIEVAKASLDKASKNATMTFHDGTHKTNRPKTYFQIGADNLQVNKESIIKESNIVIL